MSSLCPPISWPWVVVTWCLCVIIGSGGGCVGLLWAVDAQRGQCSLAVRETERLAVEMQAGSGVRSSHDGLSRTISLKCRDAMSLTQFVSASTCSQVCAYLCGWHRHYADDAFIYVPVKGGDGAKQTEFPLSKSTFIQVSWNIYHLFYFCYGDDPWSC